jgi:hypothetical protein
MGPEQAELLVSEGADPHRILLERPLNNGLTTSHKLESMLPMFKNYPTYALKEVMLFGGQ